MLAEAGATMSQIVVGLLLALAYPVLLWLWVRRIEPVLWPLVRRALLATPSRMRRIARRIAAGVFVVTLGFWLWLHIWAWTGPGTRRENLVDTLLCPVVLIAAAIAFPWLTKPIKWRKDEGKG
jgi:hypothetical protein